MELLTYSSLILILPFAIICIYNDIKHRKIPNKINLLFLYITLLAFTFFLTQLTIFDIITFITSIFLGFIGYKKDIWGGADGKIFIALSMFLISFGKSEFFFNFIVNLALIYSATIIFLTLIATNTKIKIKVIKEINFGMYIFQLLIVFILVKNFLKKLTFQNTIFTIIFLLGIFILLKFLNPYFQQLYLKLNKLNKDAGLLSNLTLFFILVFISSNQILIYFFIILFLKTFSEFISTMTLFLQKNNKTYESPFSIYLFFAAIFTLISTNNIAQIILNSF